MTTEKDGKKRIGRFIRKNDPIKQYCNISNFNLKEISLHPTAIPDNAQNNIVHQRLHHPEDIEKAVKPADFSKNEYQPEGGKRPVLVPLDFTKDWEAMKKRTTKRNTQFDEDEDDLDFFEEHQRHSQEQHEAALKKQEDQSSKSEAIDDSQGSSDQVEVDPQSLQSQDQHEGGILSINREKEALDDIAKQLPTEDHSPLGSNLSIHPKETTPEDPTAHNFSPNSPQNQAIDQDKLEQDINEAKQQGYDEGYNKGLEEAIMEVQNDYNEKAKTIANMMSELEGLKKDILHNAQDNFQKICESMMEAIIQKEYTTNPEAFSNVINRAIDEAVEDDEFSIRVNPEYIETLSPFFKGEIASHIIPDESINPGDFKIDSKHKFIDGSISKLIKDMLDQADVDLFAKGEAS